MHVSNKEIKLERLQRGYKRCRSRHDRIFSRLFQSIKDFLQTQPAPKLPCYVLGHEKSIQEFTRRREVLQLIENAFETVLNLTSSLGAIFTPNSFALIGTSGIGKTRLA